MKPAEKAGVVSENQEITLERESASTQSEMAKTTRDCNKD